MEKLPRTLGWAIGLLFACTLAGCNTYSSMCGDEMDCRGGNDADIDACVVGYNEQEDLADLHGCIDFWNSYVDCHAQQAHCKSDNWTDDGDCQSSFKKYSDCVN